MVCYLLVKDLSNAKYLWKRAPTTVKAASSGSMLSEVWEVGKAMWREDISASLSSLNIQWPSELTAHVLALKNSLITAYLILVARSYESIQTERLASSLLLTQEEVLASKITSVAVVAVVVIVVIVMIFVVL
jgi:hypothetical protein